MIVIHVAAPMTEEESSRIRVDEFDIGWVIFLHFASLDTDTPLMSPFNNAINIALNLLREFASVRATNTKSFESL